MTTLPPAQPLWPVLGRMALGLLIVAGGALLSLPGVQVRPTPGLEAIRTPLSVPLDGPLPLDLASGADLRLSVDRADLKVQTLARADERVLGGWVGHRARNSPQLGVTREGRRVRAALNLTVRPSDRGGLVVSGPEPFQHRVELGVTRRIPLNLSAQSSGGRLNLDLTPLRLWSLSTRSGGGAQQVTLPGRAAGPVSLVSGQGAVTVKAPPGAAPEALRVNTEGGDLALDLAGAQTGALGVGTGTGAVRLTLPRRLGRGTVTTLTGDITVTARPGTRGNLDIRTQAGRVVLKLWPTSSVRVRFTDRDTLNFPKGRPEDRAPDLDLFVDSYRSEFRAQMQTEGP